MYSSPTGSPNRSSMLSPAWAAIVPAPAELWSGAAAEQVLRAEGSSARAVSGLQDGLFLAQGGQLRLVGIELAAAILLLLGLEP